MCKKDPILKKSVINIFSELKARQTYGDRLLENVRRLYKAYGYPYYCLLMEIESRFTLS